MVMFFVLKHPDGNLEVFNDYPCPCESYHRYSNCCYKVPDGCTVIDRVVFDNEGKSDNWLVEQVTQLLLKHASGDNQKK